MSPTDRPDVPELCHRLHRETSAQAVLVCGPEGEILGHAGVPGELGDDALDAVGDATVAVLRGGEAPEPTSDADDHVSRAGTMHLCAAPLGNRAVLVVLFEDESSLTLVRLRMRRARELILRSLEVG